MKIVFCGPPHSGKSVFIANLIENLPTDAYTIIRACPDGEGTWSNNSKQSETSVVRKKGQFTQSFIDDSCKAIDNQVSNIVLVDVGGVMSKENEQVFKHCDSFVVLSSDNEKKKEWLEFGERLGLECVGCLDSKLEGQEEIYSREPYLQGRIVGLERGELLQNSSVIKALVSDIIRRSKYTEKTDSREDNDGIFIDDTELGFELGYGREILTDDGTPIKKVRWLETSIPDVSSAIKEKVDFSKQLKINGIRANFILCAICKSAKQQGVKDIRVYDIRMKQYIPIKNFPKKRGLKETAGLSFNIIENDKNVFMDIDITKERFTLEDFEQCVLPQIKENKNLYLSGRLPLWLLASISNSYDSSRIFTFQPGKGFTFVSSKDEKDLGKVVDVVEGIDINRYFEDKKERNKSKLPDVTTKQNIFAKIKSFFSKYIRKNENTKYIDSSIKVSEIESPVSATSVKSKFEDEIHLEIEQQQSNLTKNEESKKKNNWKQQKLI